MVLFEMLNLVISVSNFDYTNNKLVKYLHLKYKNIVNSKDYLTQDSLLKETPKKDEDPFEELSKTQVLDEIHCLKN